MAGYRIPKIFTGAHRRGFRGFRRVRSPQTLFDPADPRVMRRSSVYTHDTIVNGRTPKANKNTSRNDMAILRGEADAVFDRGRVYEVAAAIGGMPVMLRTNSPHLANFWSLNWYLIDGALMYKAAQEFAFPMVTLRAAVADRDPGTAQAFYCPDTNEIVFLNTDYYGQCKSWALGAAGVGLSNFGVHSIHGACVELDGPSFRKRGILLVAPTGSGKSTYTNVLARINEIDPQYGGRVNSDDWVYVKDGIAYPSERFIYVRTNAVDDTVPEADMSNTMRKMKTIFDEAPCENVPQEGARRLYGAVPNSRAMIDPRSLSEMAYATPVKLVVLLRRSDATPFLEELDAQRAVAVLEEGEYMVQPGAGPKELWGTMANESWYNPYLLRPDPAFERRKFAELKERFGARYVLINTSPAVAPREFGILKPKDQITTHDIERTVEGTARLMLELLEETQ